MDGDKKIILVKRKTRLEELVYKYNTMEQARFYIEHLGQDFSIYLEEDREYTKALKSVSADLESYGMVQWLDRTYLSNFLFGEKDLVVVVGQDGLVANTLKYLDKQMVIGVNPSPKRYDGILLPFHIGDIRSIIKDINSNKYRFKEVTMAKATLNDGQELIGVNDLFIGQRSHISARYSLQVGSRQEVQSSSGIIISTGLGSTGWLKSVIQGATQVVEQMLRQSSHQVMTQSKSDSGKQRDSGRQNDSSRQNLLSALSAAKKMEMAWNSDYLMYSVREPFPSSTTGTTMTFGKIDDKSPLKVTSLMPENGVIFSDGMEADFLEFSSGKVATIGIHQQKGRLVV